jgi:hypothetical protein
MCPLVSACCPGLLPGQIEDVETGRQTTDFGPKSLFSALAYAGTPHAIVIREGHQQAERTQAMYPQAHTVHGSTEKLHSNPECAR